MLLYNVVGFCIARAQHLDMSRCCDVAKFCPLVVKLLATCCRIVGVSSVGGVAVLWVFAHGVIFFHGDILRGDFS